jgi:hypothetical protein
VAEPQLTQTRIRAGVWEGLLEDAGEVPRLSVTHLGRPVPGVTVTALPDRPHQHAVRVPIPADALSEGVQTFLVQDEGSGATLAHFTVATGLSGDEDLRAEVDLLRAELDMLKRAFRRHCLETSG